MGVSRTKVRKVWSKLFGFKAGDRVRVIDFKGKVTKNPKLIGRVGIVQAVESEYAPFVRVILNRGQQKMFFYEEELEKVEE